MLNLECIKVRVYDCGALDSGVVRRRSTRAAPQGLDRPRGSLPEVVADMFYAY